MMTFAEIQAILVSLTQSHQEARAEMAEQRREHDREMAEIKASQLITESIVNSNARAIEALGNQQAETYAKTQAQFVELIRVVGQFAEATNTRLDRLEN